MALHSLSSATVVVVAFGMVVVQPAYAQRRDGSLLPQDKSGQVTAVGCLVKGDAVRGGKKDKYVLARPKKGPVASVPEATCTVDPGADALTLDNPEKAKMTDAMVGHWMQISGRLESETDKNPDNLRELDVLTAKMVPVVVPKAAAAASPAPEPAARQRRARPRHRHRRRRLHLRRHPQSLVSCRRRRASFQRLDWPGCSRWQRPSCFARSVSGNEGDAADTDTDRGHDSSRCCALRRNPLTVSSVWSWRPRVEICGSCDDLWTAARSRQKQVPHAMKTARVRRQPSSSPIRTSQERLRPVNLRFRDWMHVHRRRTFPAVISVLHVRPGR